MKLGLLYGSLKSLGPAGKEEREATVGFYRDVEDSRAGNGG